LLPPSEEHFELIGDEGPDCGSEEQPLDELDRAEPPEVFFLAIKVVASTGEGGGSNQGRLMRGRVRLMIWNSITNICENVVHLFSIDLQQTYYYKVLTESLSISLSSLVMHCLPSPSSGMNADRLI